MSKRKGAKKIPANAQQWGDRIPLTSKPTPEQAAQWNANPPMPVFTQPVAAIPERSAPRTEAEVIQAKHVEIGAILAELPAPMQGHVLAMLTGTWLSGFRVVDADKEKGLEKQQSIRARMMVLQTRAAFTYAGLRDEMRQKQESEAGCGTATGGGDISGTDRGVAERHGASAGDRGGDDTPS